MVSKQEAIEAALPVLPPLFRVGDLIQGRPPLLHEGQLQQGLQLGSPALALRPIVHAAELEGEVHLLRVLLGQCLHGSHQVQMCLGTIHTLKHPSQGQLQQVFVAALPFRNRVHFAHVEEGQRTCAGKFAQPVITYVSNAAAIATNEKQAGACEYFTDSGKD